MLTHLLEIVAALCFVQAGTALLLAEVAWFLRRARERGDLERLVNLLWKIKRGKTDE